MDQFGKDNSQIKRQKSIKKSRNQPREVRLFRKRDETATRTY